MRGLHYGLINAAALFFFALAAILLYWTVSDRTPPVSDIQGHIAVYDPANHYMVVEWSAFKNRYCPGERVGWVRESGDEPPPRTTITLGSVTLPPENFRGEALPSGQEITWRTMIELPYGTPEHFTYGAQWVFRCNLMQYFKPIRIDSPRLTVAE